MARFIGEFECKIDDKGRIVLPSKLRSQIPDKETKTMVINRGFEKCLVLYTMKDWVAETQKLSVLNSFNREARRFIRQYNNGANTVQIDSSSRINIPKNLSDYAGLKSELVIYAYENKIEIWNKELYQQEVSFTDEEFAQSAETLLGGINFNQIQKPKEPEQDD
jgi:MraZ protein